MKKIRKNYINNKDFYDALVLYKTACKKAETENKEKPPVTKYIGTCIWQIATRLASKPNFSGYTFKDDMIMDGVENSILYIHNFDPDKYQNPFAYFTKIIWFAFLRRIAKEKKQMYIKFKSSQELISMGETYGGEDLKMYLNIDISYINDFIRDFETKNNKELS
jgi:hypothetical protein